MKVLAVGKEIETSDQARREANPVTVATLLVNPQQAEKLALAANEGRLILTLRSWTDTASVATVGSNPSNLLAEAGVILGVTDAPHPVVETAAEVPSAQANKTANANQKRRGATAARPPSALIPAKKDRDVVEILRGDRFEERKFDSKVAPRR
ncbi:MAG: hypothetical protein H7X95_14640 [Deltaproteobacteria bacterium]|nr:hypothetical protein [Deltaproteobacteria bacterium]